MISKLPRRLTVFDTSPVVNDLDVEGREQYLLWMRTAHERIALERNGKRSLARYTQVVLGHQDYCWAGHRLSHIWERTFYVDSVPYRWRLFVSTRGFALEVEIDQRQERNQTVRTRVVTAGLCHFMTNWKAPDFD